MAGRRMTGRRGMCVAGVLAGRRRTGRRSMIDFRPFRVGSRNARIIMMVERKGFDVPSVGRAKIINIDVI